MSVPTKDHRHRRPLRSAAIIAAAIGGLLAPMAITATANAVPTCWNLGYDQSTGYATANCSGTGQARFIVECDAVPPYYNWVKTSGWINVNGGGTLFHIFPNCPWPASYDVFIERR